MSEYSQCPNGHYYKNSLSACPYCPASQSMDRASGGMNSTQITQPGGLQQNLGKTQILGGAGNSASGSTQILGGKRDLSRTFIAEATDKPGDSTQVTVRSSRKLTGLLISYTIDPMGVDFKIFEGNNTIGREKDCSICITTDTTISSHHATILNKKDKFYLKDDMAANGTFINGEELEVGKPYELRDKDIIRVGATTLLKFHTAE